MTTKLHANATTTPARRAQIQQSEKSVAQLAQEFGLTETTVRRWKGRTTTEDRSHQPHKMNTSLSESEEQIVVELRKTLLLATDDLLAVVREFIFDRMGRSSLGRLLRRHGVSQLSALMPEAETKPAGQFKAYLPGFVHVDVKYLPKMPDQDSASYLFVAIDRATRWVYLEVLPNKTAEQAEGFLSRLLAVAPFHITKMLTDNGKEFTDRFCRTGERTPTGNHVVDQLCAEQQIEHRLIPPRHPQTNGMVERFNGRVTQELKQTRFESEADLTQGMLRYGSIYNQHFRQRALGHRTPVEARTPHTGGDAPVLLRDAPRTFSL